MWGAALVLQGSSNGYAALAVMLAMLFFSSLDHPAVFLRFLETVMLLSLFGFLMWLFRIGLILPHDVVYRYTPAWGAVLLVCGGIWGLLRMVCIRKKTDFWEGDRIRKVAMWAAGILLITGAVVFAGCQVSDALWNVFGKHRVLRFDSEWGSMRGQLWAVAWRGFWEGGLGRWLYGVGPDCFARYFYGNYPMDIMVSGQWQDAVYANAHNEWLNMLINEGIMGLTAYLGFFLSALGRFWAWRRMNRILTVGVMAVAAYGVNQFFSFGQVVSTPLIFVRNCCKFLIFFRRSCNQVLKGLK